MYQGFVQSRSEKLKVQRTPTAVWCHDSLPQSSSRSDRVDSLRAPRRTGWLLGVVALSLFVCRPVCAAQSATLAWDTSPNPGTTGYFFYRGTQSGVYTSRFDVGTNTAINLTGLQEGQTNFFMVTAYNASRMESAPSAQIAYIVPGLMKLKAATRAGNPAQLSFPVAPGHTYQIEASTDLKTWAVIFQTASSTSNAWYTYSDPQSSSYAKRFYRLILQ